MNRVTSLENEREISSSWEVWSRIGLCLHIIPSANRKPQGLYEKYFSRLPQKVRHSLAKQKRSHSLPVVDPGHHNLKNTVPPLLTA